MIASDSAVDSTVIRTLRIKTARSDRLAARQQTEHALQAASLRPIGLPRDAILIVRRITARHAGTMDWEQAVNAELDQLARQAARPIEGAVPANAEAVLFADRSELLACLAADWCAGVVRSQWWWHSWLRSTDVTYAVIETWLAAPEYMPLALQRLVVRQQAIVFIQRLSDTHVRSIWQAVVQAFGLYQLSSTLAENRAMELMDREVMATSPARAAPPWQPWVQAHVEHLSLDRQVLFAVGLMLTVAPRIVRSASFASEVKAWRTSIRALSSSAVPVASIPTVVPLVTTESITAPQGQGAFVTRHVQIEEATSDQPSLRGVLSATKQSPSEQLTEPIISEAASSPTTTLEEANVSLTSRAERPIIAVPNDSLMLSDVTSSPLIIETEFGGVCYFINLGLFLGLYGDFTTPLRPGLDLPIWDFMALVAQELLGDDVTRDPIWPLLAQLADRDEDEPPGANFDPPDDWIRGFAKHPRGVSRLLELSRPPAEASTPASWLADLMSIIRPRLQLALGVSADDLPRYFKQRARIIVSALNFDAYFALADLPIEIRLSGLDRDPGWVPAAGRTVRFHYD